MRAWWSWCERDPGSVSRVIVRRRAVTAAARPRDRLAACTHAPDLARAPRAGATALAACADSPCCATLGGWEYFLTHTKRLPASGAYSFARRSRAQYPGAFCRGNICAGTPYRSGVPVAAAAIFFSYSKTLTLAPWSGSRFWYVTSPWAARRSRLTAAERRPCQHCQRRAPR